MFRSSLVVLLVVSAACSGSDSVSDSIRDSIDETVPDAVETTPETPAETTSDTTAATTPETSADSIPETSEDSAGGDSQPYVDLLADDFAGDPAFPISDEAAECIARVTVETIGVDELESAGVAPEDLSRAGALTDLGIEVAPDFTAQLAERFDECADFGATIADGLVSDLNVAEGSLDCVGDELDRAQFNMLLAEALASGGDSTGAGEAFGEELILGLSDECSKDFFLAVGLADGLIDETQQSCLEEQLEPELAQQLLGAQRGGDAAAEAAATAIRPVLIACGVDVAG